MSDEGFTNIQIKHGNADAVRAALVVCGIEKCKLFARAKTNWVSLYPSESECADLQGLGELVHKLAEELRATVLGVTAGGTEYGYILCSGTETVDRYTSEKVLTAKNLEFLRQNSAIKISKDETRDALLPEGKRIESEEKFLHGLGHVLGIPRAQISMGFSHLKEAQAGR